MCTPRSVGLVSLLLFLAASLPSVGASAAGPYVSAATNAIENFHRVSDVLYRCAQPEDQDFTTLEHLGIRTVINLRSSHVDAIPAGSSMRQVRIPMTADKPSLSHVEAFLKVVADTNNLPALVHCRRGADRTGLMVAAYRVVMQGWPKEKAITEMRDGGFHFNKGYRDIVELVQSLDPKQLRAQLGLPDATP